MNQRSGGLTVRLGNHLPEPTKPRPARRTAPPATLSTEDRLAALRRLDHLSKYAWKCGLPDCDGDPHPGYPNRHARRKQRAPQGAWWAWFLMSGRGFGKTRTAAEWMKDRMLSEPGHRAAIVVPDFPVGRDICVEGESGLHGLEKGDGCIPPEYIAGWNRSSGELTLTNKSKAKIFSTHTQMDAEKLRGFQCHSAWVEELATQRFGKVAWDMLTFTLRLGDDPRAVITGTPRPIPLVKSLLADDGIIVTRGSTYDNAANLAGPFLARVRKKYEGTSLGQQELYGELLDGSVGALWAHPMFQRELKVPAMARIVVAVDPAGTAHATSDETGIVVVGLDHEGRCWVLADKTGKFSPEGWRAEVVTAYHDFQADAVVAEVNFGADMVAANMRAGGERIPFIEVRASRGKERRATPVVTAYERGQVIHWGVLAELEDELTTWIPPGRFDAEGDPIPESDWSPNRLDAMVWGVSHLILQPAQAGQSMSMPEEY